ncbi:hypothetical protein MKY91_17335 [Alkalicoccobacillus gibsonii]|uniref:Lipocalin-like domain-containing protein n=1 Tax=Alkalicoccobacillus gibsonii TaxID=79881 RepID=A0ABU9VLZ7_9BACI
MIVKWKYLLGAILLCSVLTACSVSNEERAIGTWQVEYDGEKLDSFLIIAEDQTVTIDEGNGSGRRGTEEYRIIDTDEDSFTLEIADRTSESYYPIFEGFFDDSDTIVLGSESDGNQGDVLIRVGSIKEARAELN